MAFTLKEDQHGDILHNPGTQRYAHWELGTYTDLLPGIAADARKHIHTEIVSNRA
jgi:hypothetical protein